LTTAPDPSGTEADLHARFGEPWPPIAGTPLDVRPDVAQAPYTELDPEATLHGQLVSIGLLRNGTTEGRASVALVARLDDGRYVIAETTWRLFNTASRALAASPAVAEETS